MIKQNSQTKILSTFFSTIILLLINTNLLSQVNADAHPYISHYTAEEYGAFSQNWSIIRDKAGAMYFANNRGLLKYDGTHWSSSTNRRSSSLRSLAIDKFGNIYYGGSGDFGMIIADSLGGLEFMSLFESYKKSHPAFNNIWNMQIIGEYVYFQAFEAVFKVKFSKEGIANKNIENNVTIFKPNSQFHWSFNVNDKFYVREEGEGIKTEVNNKLELIAGSEIFANDRVYVMIPFKNETILIGSRNKGFVIYDPNNKENAFTEFKCESSDFIKQAQLYGGFTISEGKYLAYTLQRGLIIFDNEGKIIDCYNEKFGIEENSIVSAYYDLQSHNLWFSGNVAGIYMASLSSPYRGWKKNNGLDGAVIDITRFNNKIHVATSFGVFRMQNKLSFKQLENIKYESWDFVNFKLNDNTEKLLVATTGGLFEIDKDERVRRILSNRIVLYAYQSQINSDYLYLGFMDGFGAIKYNQETGNWGKLEENKSVKNIVSHIYETKTGNIYLGNQSSGITKLNKYTDPKPLQIDSAQGLTLSGSSYNVYEINNKLFIASAKGIFEFNEETNKAKPYNLFGIDFEKNNIGVYKILDINDQYWFSLYSNDVKSTDNKKIWTGIWSVVKNGKDSITIDKTSSAIIPNILIQAMYLDSNYVWIGNENGVYRYDRTMQKNNKHFNIAISKVNTVSKGKDSILFKGNFYKEKNNIRFLSLKQDEQLMPKLPYALNQLNFEYSALFFEKEKETKYSFRLIGLTNEWSEWKDETKYSVTNLSPGDYRFEVKAKNIYNIVSNIASYEFTILPPWYLTVWAFIGAIVLMMFLIWFVVRLNTRRLKKDKERLEKIVMERTSEIREQNQKLEQQKQEISEHKDEIETQRDHVIAQKDQIETQHKLILDQTNNIKDSIRYASNIQLALLPPDEILSEMLPEYFVFFRPRDIVSGDFYWAAKKNDKIIIAVADCTGHGVPGAFMSMLGMTFLNDITNQNPNIHANEILNKLRERVKKSLHQTGKDNEAKDGMDMSLCIFNFNEMKMEFAGAYNSLCMVRDNEMKTYKADRMPVGIYLKDKDSFTNYTIDIQKDDRFYMFSDGYSDQFGGTNGSKFMQKHFKKLLLDNHQLPAKDQERALAVSLDKWLDYKDAKGNPYTQIDDILVMGIRV